MPLYIYKKPSIKWMQNLEKFLTSYGKLCEFSKKNCRWHLKCDLTEELLKLFLYHWHTCATFQILNCIIDDRWLVHTYQNTLMNTIQSDLKKNRINIEDSKRVLGFQKVQLLFPCCHSGSYQIIIKPTSTAAKNRNYL